MKWLAAAPVGLVLVLLLLTAGLGSSTSALACQGDSGAGGGSAPGGVGPLSPSGIPTAFVGLVEKAGRTCPEFPAPVIAAQIQQESGWNPNAASGAGAVGLSQFMPGTWATSGVDGNGDGRADPLNPADAVASQAKYDCSIAAQIRSWVSSGQVRGNVTELALAAYNAGPGAVQAAGGIPSNAETAGYVPAIMGMAKTRFSAAGGAGGTVAAAADTSGAAGGVGAGGECVAGGDSGPVPPGAAGPIIAAARRWLGTPYAWGGGGIQGPSKGIPDGGVADSFGDYNKTGFDCSGLVQYAYYAGTQGRMNLARPAQAQYTATAAHQIPGGFNPARWQPGDLMFYGQPGNLHHIAMYIGGGKLIQAPQSGGVVEIKPVYNGDWYATTRPLAGVTH